MVALLAAACGSSGTSSAPTATVLRPDVGLLPPGTELAPGFVVPVGAQLIGPVFPRPEAPIADTTSRVAVLQVDGNPFAAWDDLADQATAAGAAMPHSGVCQWLASAPGPNGIVPPSASVSMPRRPDADVLVCDAAGRGASADHRLLNVQVRLWWWAAGAEIGIEISDGDNPAEPSAFPDVDPGRAPASAVDELPPRAAASLPTVGQPFGLENNCFERGYDRLVVPRGARVVGGGTTPGLADFAAVLAVSDAKAVLEALLAQLDRPETTGGSFTLEEVPLAGDAGSAWQLSGGIEDGGGGCSMWASPDGHAVLVTTHSD